MSTFIKLGIGENGPFVELGGAKRSRPLKGKSILKAIDDFTVIDLETTGLCPEYDSIIEMSAIRFRSGIAVDHFDSLVNPEMELDDFIIDLTGITDEMLATAPTIGDVLPKFVDFIGSDVLIGHNVSFDINFIYDECENCGLPGINNDYIDTMRLSRRMNKEFPNHKLDTLLFMMGLPERTLHRALGDCELTAACYQKMISDKEAFDVAIANPKKAGLKAKDVIAEAGKENIDSPLFGQVCVFTGTLDTMLRRDAMQIVADIGGICADNVTKKTNFLILGNNDYCKSIKDGKSNKQKKAEELILQGQDLKIIPEAVFLDMLYSNAEGYDKNLSDEESAYEQLKPHLLSVIEKNWVDPEKLYLKARKNYYSIMFGANVVARIYSGTFSRIEVPKFDGSESYIKLFVDNDLENCVDFASDICQSLQHIIDSYPTDFSCCSRYEECSDAIACTNPDRALATGCSYRKSLKNGKVFYGKNRNVD